MNVQKKSKALLVLLAVGVTIGLAGCKPNRAIRSGAVVDSGVKQTEAPAKPAVVDPNSGTVMGVVHFKGKVPKRLKIDMSRDQVCSITGGTNLTEQYVVHDGNLQNVYVYVKDGPPEAMNAAASAGQQQPVVLDEIGCRYVPHVVAVMKGGAVEFRNSDGTMHNVHTMSSTNAGLNILQGAKGAPEMKTFDRPELMIPVRCKRHPWMSGFINISATPFFAVTGPDGRFDLSGLPPGMYTLGAVHEKLGEQTLTVTVASKSQTQAEFTYTAK